MVHTTKILDRFIAQHCCFSPNCAHGYGQCKASYTPYLAVIEEGQGNSAGLGQEALGELCTRCYLPLLPQLACSIHATWEVLFWRAL